MATKRAPTTQQNLRTQCLEAGRTARMGAMGPPRPPTPQALPHPQRQRRTCIPESSLKASRMMKTGSQQKASGLKLAGYGALQWETHQIAEKTNQLTPQRECECTVGKHYLSSDPKLE